MHMNIKLKDQSWALLQMKQGLSPTPADFLFLLTLAFDPWPADFVLAFHIFELVG